MAVANITPIIEHTGNGISITFTFPFDVVENNDLFVYFDGVLVVGGYSLIGIGDGSAGGSVEFIIPPAIGVVVRIRRNVPLNRSVDYIEGGGIPTDTLDADIDRTVMMIQDLSSVVFIQDTNGNLDMMGNRIINMATPIDPNDAANKTYVDNTLLAGDSLQIENFTAIGGQTIFNFTGSYAPGTNAISVHINGVLQHTGSYTETDNNTITMAEPLLVGDLVQVNIVSVGTKPILSGIVNIDNFVATMSQTLFTLSGAYLVNTNSIRVYINGVYQHIGAFTETSDLSITFTEPLDAGDLVQVETITIANAIVNGGGIYEPVFDKNTGFNLDLGTIAGTVAEGNHDHGLNINTQAGASYTIDPSDVSGMINMTSAVANILTVPNDGAGFINIGSELILVQSGVGTTTIAPAAGVVVNSAGGFVNVAGQYDAISLVKMGANEWLIVGNLV